MILNGASSAGKTTLATTFRSRRAAEGELWVLIALDDYLEKVPAEWFRGGDFDGPWADDGLRFEPGGPGVEAGGDGGGLVVRTGPSVARLLRGYRRAVAACARAGLDVIVDEVVFDAGTWDDWGDALAGLDPVWVGVRCDPAVLDRREAARPERAPGLARGLAGVVHRSATYALELDTTATAPEELVARLEAFLAGAR